MMVDPHAHFHVIPRSAESRQFNEIVIADQDGLGRRI